MVKQTKTAKKRIIKKKPEKVMVAPLPEVKAPKDPSAVIAALASLQASEGWAIIVGIMNENIAYLEKAILEKVDPESDKNLSDSEVEILRLKRGLNIEVRDTPVNYSKKLQEGDSTAPDFDPYFKTKEEIDREDNRKKED